MDISDPVRLIPGIGEAVAKRLERLEIRTIGELVTHYPRRYEDWQTTRPIKSVRIDEEVVIKATIGSITNERSPRKRAAITKAVVTDDSGQMAIIWFGQPFLTQTLTVGRECYFRGKVSYDRATGLKQLISPTYEWTRKIAAVYPETAGLSSKQLRLYYQRLWPALHNLPDMLPDWVRNEEQLPGYLDALKIVHQPANFSELHRAQERLAFEELYQFSLRLGLLKRQLKSVAAPAFQPSEAELRCYTAALPFELTPGQKKAAWEIIQDLAKPEPMNRLLQGDVGSGKTAVGAFAAFVVSRSGYRTVWLAPTEILAVQHQESLSRLLAPFGLTVGLWTGQTKFVKPADDGAAWPDIVVGTHAVFSADFVLPQLGLVVVDEQHRFGVAQRATLRQDHTKTGNLAPHFLSMTATPIPRTLALALYGDLDVSVIRQRPGGRQPVITQVISLAEREKTYQFIRNQIESGRQAFVVCPLIETKEGIGKTLFDLLEQKTATAAFQELTTKVFPDLRVGLLHGRLKSKEKQRVMHEFAIGQLDILVATAVIEVGIDVPNASIMLIEGANHFGLAQLHQLRGRVGRGEHQSFCFLLSDNPAEFENKRLAAMERTESGFELAETDLALRGPGEFLGTSQSGFPEFKMANLMDFSLIERARKAAERALARPETTQLAGQAKEEPDMVHWE